jgi:hypothetical protein
VDAVTLGVLEKDASDRRVACAVLEFDLDGRGDAFALVEAVVEACGLLVLLVAMKALPADDDVIVEPALPVPVYDRVAGAAVDVADGITVTDDVADGVTVTDDVDGAAVDVVNGITVTDDVTVLLNVDANVAAELTLTLAPLLTDCETNAVILADAMTGTDWLKLAVWL